MKADHEYDFHNGVRLTTKEIDRKQRAAVQFLRDNPAEDWCEWASGSCIVIGLRREFGIKLVVVTRGYVQKEFYNPSNNGLTKPAPMV